MLSRPSIILSDLHLGPTCPPDTSTAVAQVLRRHPGHETMLLGDTFDLSIDPPSLDPALSVARHMTGNPEFREALRERLSRGVPVTLFAGNHDAQLVRPNVRAGLLSGMGLNDTVPLRCGLWCAERYGVHLEHGHIYDPDNAPSHPLVAPSGETEPLGVCMMRRVLAPTGSLFFAHAHELTPLRGLAQAFVQLGLDAPYLVARYYLEAARVFARARPASFSNELSLGDALVLEFANTSGLDGEWLQRLLELRPVPRHHRKKDVFYRLYLDRSIATAVWWLTSILGAVTALPAFWGMTGGSLADLAWSLARGKNRYRGHLLSRMRKAAIAVRSLVDARAVVFGHTHVQESCLGYVNNGSFGFGGTDGRSYLLLEPSGVLLRAFVNGNQEPRPLDVLVPRESDASAKPEAAA